MSRTDVMRMVEKEPFNWDHRNRRIAFISGLSDPNSCRLSALQQEWMAQLRVPEDEKVYWNFPYIPDDSSSNRNLISRPVPIWKGSIANFVQYRTMLNERYQIAAKRHINALTNATVQRLVLVAISSGLEIIRVCQHSRNAESVKMEQQFVPDEWLRKKSLFIVALGPVARGIPKSKFTSVLGSRDWISRWFFSSFDYRIPGIGHLDYLKSNLVTEIIQNALQS